MISPILFFEIAFLNPGPIAISGIVILPMGDRSDGCWRCACEGPGLSFQRTVVFFLNNGSWRSYCLYHSLLLPTHLAFPCQALPGEEVSSPLGGPGVIGGPGLLLCSDWQDTWAAGVLTGWTPCFVKLWLLLWFSIPWRGEEVSPI